VADEPSLAAEGRIDELIALTERLTALIAEQAQAFEARRPQDAARQRRLISVGGVQVIDDLALVPDVVAGGDDVDAEFEQLFGNLRSDAEAAGGVLAVGDGEFNAVLPL